MWLHQSLKPELEAQLERDTQGRCSRTSSATVTVTTCTCFCLTTTAHVSSPQPRQRPLRWTAFHP